MTTEKSFDEPTKDQKGDITRRLLGSSAIVSHDPDKRDIDVTLDVTGLIRRLILFDTYILYSVRLKEIPELVRYFGFAGTMTLLSSGALEIRHECAQLAEGQFNTSAYPLMTFQFHALDAHVWEQYLIDGLPEVRKALLSSRQTMDLQGAVIRAVQRSDNRQMFATEVVPEFEGAILNNDRLVKAAVSLVLAKDYGIGTIEFSLRIHKVGDDRYTVDTDLSSKLQLSPESLHGTFKKALLGVAGLFQRVGEMKAHVAISGFTEEELSLFRTKFEALTDAMGSKRNEDRFLRVITLAGFSGEIFPNTAVDIEKILQIRDEPETIEFRAWLADTDSLSDAEIKERVRSLNAKIGLAVQTTAGKAIRFLTTSIAGIIPPIGIGLGFVDQFLWDKFFRRSGVAAFINELYPSIFREDKPKSR